MVSTKKSKGTFPFQFIYGTNAIFPASLGMPVMKYIQEENSELNPTQRRINQQLELHQFREVLCDMTHTYQEKMKQVLIKELRMMFSN